MKSTHQRFDAAWTRRPVLLALAIALVLPVGCGDEGSGEASGPSVTLRVTREFGHEPIASEDRAPYEGHETVLKLLEDYTDVETVSDGDVVESIDGHKANYNPPEGEDETTWGWYVNGIETDVSAPEYKLYPGDVVNYDLRYWYVTLDVRAAVNAFPQTFTRGFEGKRFPVRVLCEKPSSGPCRHVKRVLRDAGVDIGPSAKRSKFKGRVLVGRWEHWRDRTWPKRIDRGPRYSGIFARFSPDGEELRLLDWKGHYARSERGDVGLVGAMRPTELDFMWVVTGLNDAGVANAARALDSERLRDAFALVVTAEGDEKIPLEPPR